MKKILYVITQAEWGGAQRYIFDLATNLPVGKYTAEVAAGAGSGELLKRLRGNNIPAHNLKHLTRAINPLRDILAVWEIKKLIKKTKPDIIHLNSSKAGVIGSLAGRLAGVGKTIYTVHGFVFNERLNPLKKNIYRLLERWGAARIDKIIAVSDFDRKSGIRIGINPEKIIIIHNGISPASLDLAPQKLAREKMIAQIKQPGRLLGVIANLYHNKGLDILIKAMTNVKARLVIIGQGLEKNSLLDLIKKLKLNNKVFLLGYMADASRFLPGFDLFVLPSRKEGFPYVLLEAGAAGVPVVATAVGGVPEIIHHKINGYLVEANDPHSLAKTINHALNNPLPFHLDNDFSLEKMLTETMRIYGE